MISIFKKYVLFVKKKFFDRSGLRKHLKTHDFSRILAPTYLPEDFVSELKKVGRVCIDNVMVEVNSVCSVCFKILSAGHGRKLHEELHKNPKSHKAFMEKKLFETTQTRPNVPINYGFMDKELKEGPTKATRYEIQCEICHRGVESDESLKEHIIKVHTLFCDHCDYQSKDIILLKAHIKSHLLCSECGHQSRHRKGQLKHASEHQKSDTKKPVKPEVKPLLYSLQCKMCGRGVISANALHDHMMIHLCPGGCGQMFSSDKILKTHVSEKHGMKMKEGRKRKVREKLSNTENTMRNNFANIKKEFIEMVIDTEQIITPISFPEYKENIFFTDKQSIESVATQETKEELIDKDANLGLHNTKELATRVDYQLANIFSTGNNENQQHFQPTPQDSDSGNTGFFFTCKDCTAKFVSTKAFKAHTCIKTEDFLSHIEDAYKEKELEKEEYNGCPETNLGNQYLADTVKMSLLSTINKKLKNATQTDTGIKPTLYPYQCRNCNRGVLTKEAMEEHMRGHTQIKLKPKPKRGKGSRGKYKVKKVKPIVEKKIFKAQQENPYKPVHYTFQCKVCARGVLTKEALEEHMATHSKNLPCQYSAGDCIETFYTEDSVWAHMLSVHDLKFQTGMKVKIKCNQCEYRNTKKSVEIHMNRHSDVKNCVCNQCGKVLKTETCLKMHMKRHDGPYEGGGVFRPLI